MAAEIPRDRHLMFGFSMVSGESFVDNVEFGAEGTDVVPVIARPHIYDSGQGIDRSAQIVSGEIPVGMTVSAFELTQLDYEGVREGWAPIDPTSEAQGYSFDIDK